MQSVEVLDEFQEIDYSKLSDDEILNHYDNMKKMFGNLIPNSEHFPKSFKHYIKLYKLYERNKAFVQRRNQQS